MALISIAPMLEYTDRHCRFLLRLFSPNLLLYTEMVPVGALLFGDRGRFLAHDETEHPVVLQLGGSDPEQLAAAARIAADAGFDEVNLNVGCPSERVQSGRFGACLMAEPDLVAKCVSAMQAAVSIPVTVKTRIGIDDRDTFEDLADFVGKVADAGCGTVVLHARKAWLRGLSPKENRSVPPLDYERVYRLKREFPHLSIVLNGGVTTLEQAAAHLAHVDGVMIGREAYHNSWLLADVERRFFGGRAVAARFDILDAYMGYMARQLEAGVYLRHMARHLLGLFHGQPGAKAWRRCLAEKGTRPGAGLEVVEEAMGYVAADRLDAMSGVSVGKGQERPGLPSGV
ncbi:MAG: tRNA dihydrouridine(20/20a) synthase DusA [Pseudomonadota bacterium]|nr:tRNA dihydrouridine(20/20a) synthase DusA [Pseudomonadota bacterium]